MHIYPRHFKKSRKLKNSEKEENTLDRLSMEHTKDLGQIIKEKMLSHLNSLKKTDFSSKKREWKNKKKLKQRKKRESSRE